MELSDSDYQFFGLLHLTNLKFHSRYYKEQIEQMSKTRQMGYFYLSWYDEIMMNQGIPIYRFISLLLLKVWKIIFIVHMCNSKHGEYDVF